MRTVTFWRCFFGSVRVCQHFKTQYKKGEHLASTWKFWTLGAHTNTPLVSNGQYHVGRDCWHNLKKLFCQPRGTHMHRCLQTHAHRASYCGPAFKSSFPEGLIVPSAQYGKSISRLCQMWWASFPPFPFFSSSNTDMHPANSHSCKQSQYVNISILILCVIWKVYILSLSFPLF